MSGTVLAAAAGALAAGFFLGLAHDWATIRHLRRRVRELRAAVPEGTAEEEGGIG